MTVTLNETNIVQKNSYYPFGLQHDNSWSRAGRENKYQFNAASELNEETGNYETYFRQYDPAIGRFMGIDILASSFSSLTPYQFANNDPIYYNDPNGDLYGSYGSRDGYTAAFGWRSHVSNYQLLNIKWV